MAELERATRACEQQLATCRQPDPDQGQPIPFPPDVPERFQQKVLVESLAAAFKETRVKGEVLVADCDEYPCLACARIGDPAQDVDVTALHKQAARLAGAASLAQFQDAEKVGGTFSARVPGSNAEQLILCQGYYPKPGDPAQAEAIQKRARARIVNMRNAF